LAEIMGHVCNVPPRHIKRHVANVPHGKKSPR
jgi:hypothetical protein